MRVSPLAIALGAVFGVVITLQPVSDSDLFWHLATGLRTLAGDLPRADVFSWSAAGAPVFTDQWLGDAIIALAYSLASWPGVLALRALAVAALVALTVDSAVAARPGRPIVAIAAALPAIALSRFAWSDRPELLALVCFVLMVRLLRGGDRDLLLTLPLLFVWAQLHGSYALGLGLILASCAARAFEDDRERWRFVPIASFAVLATLLTPSGLAAWTSAGGHFLAPPRFVAEEGVPDARTFPGVLFLITLALVVATAMTTRRVGLREAAILLPVAFVSLTAARHTPLLALAAAPYFASRWPDPLARWRLSSSRPRAAETRATTGQRAAPEPLRGTRGAPSLGRDGDPPRAGALGRAGALLASVLFIAIAVVLADHRVDESAFPRAALASVPSGRGVLNLYNWGGWLIYSQPDTPVFIDGRLFPYVPDVFDDYREIVRAGPEWESIVAKRGVTTLFVGANDAIAVRAVERGWRVAYRDQIAVVLVR